MTYCTKCGKQMPDDSRYCPHCGAPSAGPVGYPPRPDTQPPYQAPNQAPNSGVMVVHDKSEGLAAVLSFLIPGLGQIYVGKIGRGIAFLIGGVVLAMFIWVPFLLPMMAVDPESAAGGTVALASLILPIIILLAYYVYCIYDAYNLAKQYNEYLLTNNRKPW